MPKLWRMAITTKTIKGRQYRYRQRSYRVNGKVKTESVYLGPAGGVAAPCGGGDHSSGGGWLRRQFPSNHGVDWDAIEKQELARIKEQDDNPPPPIEVVLGIIPADVSEKENSPEGLEVDSEALGPDQGEQTSE